MGQRDGRDVGEHEEDLDFTLPTGTTEIGQSKSNLVYQPSSLPPSPEATADAIALRDLQRARVLAAAPPRPEEKAADPADPSPADSGRATGTPGTKARGVCFTAPRGPRPDPAGRAGERGKALTLPCRAHHSAASSFSLSGDDPGCGPSAKLRGSRGSCSGKADGWAMSHGYSPFARLALRHHLYAPRLELQCAIGCRVLGDCGVLGCGARRRATPLSREGGGAGRGAGAATSQPGIRPSARPQDREPPPPYELTSGFPVLAA